MKKHLLTVLLLLIAICSDAQNYQCLQNGITHYFINSNGYLRAAHIDSVNTYPDSVVYYPYRTPRGPYSHTSVPLTGLDPLGGSWMGKKVTQLNDGTFIFDNYWSDSTLVIKTQANPWETWTMYKDTGSLYYDAVVIRIDTMTISGMLDSVKTIIITAQNASGMVTTDSLNGFQLMLSKNNGFVQAFDMYMFPYHKPDSAFRQGSDFFMDRSTVHPNEINGNFGYTPQKRYAIFTLTDFIIPNDKELHSSWETGDIFESRYWYDVNPSFPDSFTSDTIINRTTSAHDINSSLSAIACSEAHEFSFFKNDTSFSDAIYRIVQPSFLPESKMDGGSHIFYFPGDEKFCLKSPSYIKIPVEFDPNSGTDGGDAMVVTDYKLGLGTIYEFSGVMPRRQLIFYQHTAPCGKPVFPNEIEHISAPSKHVQIFPNPVENELTITADANITSIKVTNLLGQKLFENKYSSKKATVDMKSFPAGVYFVMINDTEVRKLIKE